MGLASVLSIYVALDCRNPECIILLQADLLTVYLLVSVSTIKT